MKSNSYLLKRLSTLASSGYLSSGRGATLLYFDSMKEADAYAQSNTIENTRLMAIYWALTDTKTNRAIDNLRFTEYEHLKELCMNYDPSKDFVCHVTIRVETDTGERSSQEFILKSLFYRIDHPPYTCVSRTMVYKLLDAKVLKRFNK